MSFKNTSSLGGLNDNNADLVGGSGLKFENNRCCYNSFIGIARTTIYFALITERSPGVLGSILKLTRRCDLMPEHVLCIRKVAVQRASSFTKDCRYQYC